MDKTRLTEVEITHRLKMGSSILFVIGSIRRHLTLILCLVGVVTCGVAYLVSAVQPSYTATALITLNRPPVNVIGSGTIVGETVPDFPTLETDINIIRSEEVVRQVIKKLSLANDPEFNPLLMDASESWIPAQLEVPGSAEASSSGNSDPNSKIVTEVLHRLSAYNDRRSHNIMISFSSVDPQKAASIANGFAEIFLSSQLQTKYEAARRATSWLTERLQALRQKARTSEQALEDYLNKTNRTEIGGQTLIMQQIAQLNGLLVTAQSDRVAAESKLFEVRKLAQQGEAENAPEVLASPLILILRQQETSLVSRIADLSTQYGTKHPSIISLHNELRDLRSKIDTEVNKVIASLDNALSVARARENTLQARLKVLEKEYRSTGQNDIKLHELRREVETDQAVLAAYLQRLKETAGQDELQQPDARLVSAARPPAYPSFPNKLLAISMAFLWSVLLGSTGAVAFEYFNRGVLREDQLEDLTGIRSLGMVPELPRKFRKLHPLKRLESDLTYSEAIQSVRALLRQPTKTILITSSIPDEGKTDFAVSVALAANRSGKRVLLIDADLRRPRIAHSLSLSMRADLADLLRGDATLAEALEWVHDTSLAVIGTRGVRSSALDLLQRSRMKTLIEECKAKFDVVIIDSPPVNVVPDALEVASIVDAVVVLIRWRSTNMETVRSAVRQLQYIDAPIVGGVLSRVDLRKYRRYGFQDRTYHYGTAYAYGGAKSRKRSHSWLWR